MLRVSFALTSCHLQRRALRMCVRQALTFAKHVLDTVAFST